MPPEAPLSLPAAPTMPLVQSLALMGAIVVGVLLWLLGRCLARCGCVVSGLVLGGLGGWAVGHALADQGAFILSLVIGSAIAGALLAAMLFRIWMGLSGAALLAMCLPLALFLWQGTPLPLLVPPDADPVAGSSDVVSPAPEATQLVSEVSAAIQDAVKQQLSKQDLDTAAIATPVVPEAVRSQIQAAYDYSSDEMRRWWDGWSTQTWLLILTIAAVAAGVGLVIGLLAPYMAASVQSALVGSVLILLPSLQLLQHHVPNHVEWLPESQRAIVLSIGLITLLGVLVQWTLFGKRTDK